MVSGSPRDSVVRSLTALGLLDKFAVLVCSEDYKHGQARTRRISAGRIASLGIAPKHCLVFEDTEIGIQAATAAGMQSVLVAQPRARKHGTGAEGLNVS